MKLSTVVAAVNAIEVARDRRQVPEERNFRNLVAVVEYFNPGASKYDFQEYGKSN